MNHCIYTTVGDWNAFDQTMNSVPDRNAVNEYLLATYSEVLEHALSRCSKVTLLSSLTASSLTLSYLLLVSSILRSSLNLSSPFTCLSKSEALFKKHLRHRMTR